METYLNTGIRINVIEEIKGLAVEHGMFCDLKEQMEKFFPIE